MLRFKEWAAFILLGLVWGSSFIWIKIALEEIGPFMLVAWRLLFGLVGLLAVMAWQRQSFPRDRRVLAGFAFMGAVNTALPFVLISWGEQYIDSGLASILNATVPLFTLVIAHFWLHDEKLTLPRLAGLVVGFLGVVVLFGREISARSPWGPLAVVLASLCYAIAITFSRRHLRNQQPVLQAATSLLVADALVWLAMPADELLRSPGVPIAQALHFPALPLTWFALIWLGLLGSCLAYLLFFYLVNVWGPTRASLVTYVFPVVGLFLGILFLHEPADPSLLLGALLIVAGIGFVNVTPAQAARLLRQRAEG